MLFFSISVIVLTIFAAVIPSIGPLFDKEKNKVSHLGYVLFFICLIIIIFNSVQIFITQQEKDRSSLEREANEENNRSLIQYGIDSGINVNNAFLAKAFAAQGINFDSLKRSISIILKDTTKSYIVKNISGPDPDLDFTVGKDCIKLMERVENQYEFQAYLISRNAPSNNIKIRMTTGMVTLAGKYQPLVQDFVIFDSSTKMGTDVIRNIPFTIRSSDSIAALLINITGNYTNLDMTKKYYINSSRMYTMSSKSSGILFGPIWDSLKKIKLI